MTKVRTSGRTATVATNTGVSSATIPISSQKPIQFQDEGTDLGTKGTVDEISYEGAGINAVRTNNRLVVTVPAQTGNFIDSYGSLAALIAANPTADPGDHAYVDFGADYPPIIYVWDANSNEWKHEHDAIITLCKYDGLVATAKGIPVYTSGATGQIFKVKVADYSSEATSSRTFGVILCDSLGSATVAPGADCYVVEFGFVKGLNTSLLTEGAQGYLGAGVITTTKPSAPNHLVFLCKIIKSHAVSGSIFVGVQNGYEFEELHNVAVASVVNNDLPTWESATSLWKNKTLYSQFTADTTPLDTDEVYSYDPISGINLKTTWANVKTFLGASYWNTGGTTTLTSANTITSNTANWLNFTSTFTASNNSQRAVNFTGVLTARSTASDDLTSLLLNTTLIAGANTQVLKALDIVPTFTNGAFSNVINLALRATSGSILIGHTTLIASTTRLQIRGIGTTTGNLALFEDSVGLERFKILDNGEIYGSLVNIFGNTAPYSMRIGYQAGSTSGIINNYSISIGHNSNQGTHNIGTDSIAVGRASKSIGTKAVAIGQASDSSGNSSFAFGNAATASGVNSIAFGEQTLASTINSISIGVNSGNASGSIGSNHISIGNSANYGVVAIGAYSIAIGGLASSRSTYSQSHGFQTIASAAGAIVFGYHIASGLINSTADSVAFGWDSTSPDILFAKTANMYINNVSGNLIIGGNTANAKLEVTQAALSSLWKPVLKTNAGAHTALTSTVEFISQDFTGESWTWIDGTVATQRFNYFRGYTINKTTTSATFTNAYNVYIDDLTSGTGVTITNKWSLGLAGNFKVGGSRVNMASLPTSSAGLATGDLWNDLGTIKIA